MKNHTRIYLDYFEINEEDPFVYCEVCNARAVDIHHIESRGMGGTMKKDDICNLMALCRSCHLQYGDIKEMVDTLKELHDKKLKKK